MKKSKLIQHLLGDEGSKSSVKLFLCFTHITMKIIVVINVVKMQQQSLLN